MSPTLIGYLNRALMVNLALVGGVLGAIFLAKYFLNYLVEASSGKLPADLVGALAGLVFVSSLQYLLPLTLFFALIVTFSQLRDSQEATALTAFGASPARVMAFFSPGVAFCGVLLAGVVFVVMPWAESQRQTVLLEAGRDPAAQWLRERAFSPLPEGGVVYVGEALEAGAERRYRDVFVRLERPGEGVQVWLAQRGSLVSRGDGVFLRLEEGVGYRRSVEGGWERFHFREGMLRTGLPLPPVERLRPRAKSLPALWASEARADRAELHWRSAVVVMLFVLAWATQVLLYSQGRRRSPWPLMSLILLYALYFNALTVSVSWYRKELLDSPWWIHGFHLMPLLYVGFWGWWQERRYALAG